jgi:hypothetical protein
VSEHLESEELLALSVSTEDDAAQRIARKHVESCAYCAARLLENQALFALLDGENQPAAVSPALRARVLSSVAGRPTRVSPWARLAIAAALVTSILLAYLDGRGSELRLSNLVPSLGAHCLAFQGAFSAIPLVVGLALSRAGKVVLPPLPFAAWSMGFAVVGQVALRTHCAAHDLSVHLFAVHFVGVLLAGAVAGGLGRWLQPARAL